MEEPLRTLVAGMIGGALMGMIFVTHMALLLVYSPPALLRQRAAESTVTKLITISALVAYLSWILLGIFMAFAAQATLSSDATSISLAPSPAYLFVIVFVTLFISIPAFVLFRDRKQHLTGELVVFIGIFALLIPNLVLVLQRG